MIPDINAESVPDWVKNTAGWWATDAISENEFVNAIEFLANEGIIQVDKNCKFFGQEFEHLKKYQQEWLCNYSNFDFLEVWYNQIEINNNEINNFGFRGPEFSAEKPDDTYRIIVVGGSTVFGDGVYLEDTISENLKKILTNNKITNIKNFDVINAGINGGISHHEEMLIKNKILDFEPDMIIVYDGWNDAKVGNYNKEKYGQVQNEDLWKNRWIEICNNYNDDFELIIFVQPILDNNEKEILTDQEYTNFYSRQAIITEGNNLDKYREHVKILNSECSSAYDLKNTMYNIHEGVYFDQGHMTPLGNKIIAEQIYKKILPVINKNSKLVESINSLITDNTVENNESNHIEYKGKNIKNEDFHKKSVSNIATYFSTFTGIDFSFSDITNMDSKFSVFYKTDFQNTVIKNSVFSRTQFVESNFNNTDFSGIYLSTSKFLNSDLTNANFHNSNLRGVQIDNAILKNSDFTNADISHSELKNLNFTTSYLENSNFMGSNIRHSIFDGRDFSSIKINGGSMSTTVLTNCSIMNSIFLKNNMDSIDFTSKNILTPKGELDSIFAGSNLSHTLFSDLDLTKTIFSKWSEVNHDTFFQDAYNLPNDGSTLDTIRNNLSVILVNSIFKNVDLKNNDLSLLNMRNSQIIDSDLSNSSLQNSDLSNSTIKNSNLSGANLEGANLEGANLEGANLEGANLEGANLKCINHKICE